ncbi:MAG TPA: hypothetical protein PLR63_05925 [Paludibacteraceae bacterium]|jgi:hypothetical protein|nr:hypothetical protein [Paludibacteraceae bacterium]
MKRIKFLLQLIDGLWSVPLGFFIFFGSGLFLSSVFGMAVGQYDMAFIQPLFLAGTIVVGATNVAVLGLYFTFRTIFYYLYGRVENKVIINISKSDFETLKPIQKICISLFLFLFFVVSVIVVYLNLV